MSILADWMLLFCYFIINGMNVNIGRSDVIILLLNFKWDECESCISFAVWRVLFCHLIINGMNVNIE